MNGVNVFIFEVLYDGAQSVSFWEEVASFEVEIASFEVEIASLSCSFQFSVLHHNASYLFSKS